MFNNFFSENRTVYEIMSKNTVETEGPRMTSQYGAYAMRTGLARLYARMRMHTPKRSGTHMHARTPKHTHTSQYVILIAFPQQQWFRERATMLLHIKYIACFVLCFLVKLRRKINSRIIRTLKNSHIKKIYNFLVSLV
jgi:hypothetical protein